MGFLSKRVCPASGALLIPFWALECNARAPGQSGSEALPQAPSEFTVIIEWVVRVIEIAGIAVIILGAVAATAVFVNRVLKRQGFSIAYQRYREHLGQAILLGLEFLVAADIIGTVAIDPSFRNVGVLGLIVLVRTFLSFALEVEITGRMPWRKDKREKREVSRRAFVRSLD